ncbi:MAG TPA: glycosyltransferase [Chthoniobacter sp.]
MMHVVHLSYSDVSGGAALAAYRLHRAFPDYGVQSTMLVGSRRSEDANVIEFRALHWAPRSLNRLLFRAARRMQRRFLRPENGTFMTHDWTYLGAQIERQLPPADIYHLHWTADMLDFEMLPRLAVRAPVVWTFHDMNAFTGGCHYTQGCERFMAECGACPLIPSQDPEDATYRVIQRKVDALSKVPESRLTVVAPSRWMARETRRSRTFARFHVELIPNGIDVQAFRPMARTELRAKYGLAVEDRVILFVADMLDDRRKGMHELDQAIARIAHLPHLKILTLGETGGERMPGPMYRHLGRVNSPEKICEAYNLADIFVIPTLQDNFPNTVLEALASGTPIVGFATGGVADAIEHGRSGLLAPTGDVAGLAAQVERALMDESLRVEMGKAARARAIECYSHERQANTYAALYRRMLSQESSVAHGERLRTPYPAASFLRA